MAQFTVSHPSQQFAGDIVGIRFEDGTGTVDTDAAGGLAAYSYFQRAGYGLAPAGEPEPEAGTPEFTDPAAAFDPAAHNADEVLAHLAAADDDERARVLAAEAADSGKQRKSVLAYEATKGDQQ
ncbi:hypothetical protein BX265_4953 [Streptomyces sp. TLI_235]|nr:hypothetical protein [Streptomyces sp. TLI_235]PBC80117.1 hypothetical protein BX265_4953 [Streptomyces sp. TLI_235]